MKSIIGISCINYNKAIGINNRLLYNLKSDILFFKNITSSTKLKDKKNAVIMGSNTYFSIPKKNRPLSDRINLVITNEKYDKILPELQENTKLFKSVEDSLQYAFVNKQVENIFVIGGESIYNYFMKNNLYNKLLINEIKWPQNDIGDAFFPTIPKSLFQKRCIGSVKEKNGDINFWYNNFDYTNIQPTKFTYSNPETEYLNALQYVLTNGELRKTRNSEVYSTFGVNMKFDIRNDFPLLTTKKMYWNGIVQELLWFLRADTHSQNLEKKNVFIWKQNSSIEQIQKLKLPYQEGWCGPIYGFQWRHFNASYKSPTTKYSGKGIDQLQNCIDLLRTNPYSRRIFMTAWNPCQLDQMVLPPCHVSYQFYVTNNNELNCQMYQRSGDMFLGVPFNIASTALLVNILATMTDLVPGEISIVIGDAHIYKNHIPQVREQLKRKPFPLPTVEISTKHNRIEEYQDSDIKLKYYHSYSKLAADMIT